MCGRATLTTSPEDIQEAFGLSETPELAPRYNIAPTQPIAIVREPRHLEHVRWGLLPSGGGRLPGAGINVRVESVARAPAYRALFRSHRCLVVVDAFYEWKGERKARAPFLVRRPDRKPFALAGIWDRLTRDDGEVIDSCAILTRASEGALAELHDRMPVILPEDVYTPWLSAGDATALVKPPLPALVTFAVSTMVNNAANDVAACIEPIAPPGSTSR